MLRWEDTRDSSGNGQRLKRLPASRKTRDRRESRTQANRLKNSRRMEEIAKNSEVNVIKGFPIEVYLHNTVSVAHIARQSLFGLSPSCGIRDWFPCRSGPDIPVCGLQSESSARYSFFHTISKHQGMQSVLDAIHHFHVVKYAVPSRRMTSIRLL